MGVEPTQDEIIAPQTVLKTAAVTGPRAAPLRILSRREGRGHPAVGREGRPSAVRLQAGTVADDTGEGMPLPEPMAERLTDAAALSDDEAALLERVVAAVSCTPEAEPALRELIESLLADRMRELHAANASLEREVQERRLIELALRDSETRLRDLALTTADWLWEVDANGRYTACSRPRDGRARLHPRRDPRAHAVRPHGRGGRRWRSRPCSQRMLRERSGCSELKNRNRHKDGHEVMLLTSCVPMLNEAGELLGFRGVDKDISLREAMERSLRQRTTELEALLEAGRAMAATHRLRRRPAARGPRRRRGARHGRVRHLGVLAQDGELAVFRCLWEREPVPGVAGGTRRLQLLDQDARRRARRAARRRRRAAVALRPRHPAAGRGGHGQVGREDVAHGAARARTGSCSA